MTALVGTRDLTVHFPVAGGGIVHAVDGVTLDVDEGETLGIIGESGSGKSTLGRALVCLTRPTAGAVLHAGRDPYRLRGAEARQDRLAHQIVFQDPAAALNPRVRILDSVREPLDIAGGPPKRDRDRTALALLDRVGLRAAYADSYPHELSGGQKQRVNIARVLATQPRLIVCDEVVAALDVSLQADILNLFADLQRERGFTYAFITHDLGVVGHVSDRIAVMYLGRLVELGPAEAVTQTPLHPYTKALLSAEPVIDTLLSFPAIVLAIGVTGALGVGLTNGMLSVGLVFSPGVARLVRAQTLVARRELFVEAATCFGAGLPRVVLRHILPNTIQPIIVQTTLLLATALLAEASLSFLGLGVQPPNPSWGAMLARAYTYMEVAPEQMYSPGLAILFTALAFNAMGESLRVALDPTMRRR